MSTLVQEARRIYRRTRRNPDCSFPELVAGLRYERSRKHGQRVVRINHYLHHTFKTICQRLGDWAAGRYYEALL